MPTFTFGGHNLELDWLVSFARVSSMKQDEEHGGMGIDRQREMFRLFAIQSGVPVDNEYSVVGSASKGHHLKEGGALHSILRDATSGTIKPRTGLVVESFSRLSRLHIDDALSLFLDIVRNGVTLITLQDQSVYSRKTVRGNAGDMHTVTALLQAAHTEAEAKAYFGRGVYAQRRTRATNNTPAWIVKAFDPKTGIPNPDADKRIEPINGLTLHKTRAAIVRRIFTLALTIGGDAMAKKFNAEKLPTLGSRKSGRGFAVWERASIQQIIRGKQAMGIQEIGKYENGKRTLTGETMHAYPAAVTHDEWLAANAALDSRMMGTHTGRNVAGGFTNLFGELARCGCGSRMKVRGKGTDSIKWLACSTASTGSDACKHRKYHRIDHVERDVFKLFGGLTWQTATDDKATGLTEQVNTITARMTKRQRNIDAILADYADAPAGLRQSMNKMTKEQEADEVTKSKLERQIAASKRAKPADQSLALFQSISSRVDRLQGSELTETRGKLASLLPMLLTALTFNPSGQVVATLTTGHQIDLSDGLTGHATPNGFQIGPSVRRVGDPAPKVSASVPFRHPKGTDQAMSKRSAEALGALQRSTAAKGTPNRKAA